jgi:hypothetical protein
MSGERIIVTYNVLVTIVVVDNSIATKTLNTITQIEIIFG